MQNHTYRSFKTLCAYKALQTPALQGSQVVCALSETGVWAAHVKLNEF